MAETNPEPWGETKVVGKPRSARRRVRAAQRTGGVPAGPDLPDMLYAATLRCPHRACHGQARGPGEGARDAGRARRSVAMPIRRRISPGTAHWRGEPVSRLFDPHCRYEGEEVAAVAAENPQQAWDAVRAIAVEYETLPFVADMEEALKAGAPRSTRAATGPARPHAGQPRRRGSGLCRGR